MAHYIELSKTERAYWDGYAKGQTDQASSRPKAIDIDHAKTPFEIGYADAWNYRGYVFNRHVFTEEVN